MEEKTAPTPQGCQPEIVDKAAAAADSPNDAVRPAKICIIRDSNLRNDPVHEAAKVYCSDIKFSKDGLDLVDPDTYFIIEDFTSEVFEKLNQQKCRILGPTALLQYVEMKESLPRSKTYPQFCLHMRDVFVTFTGFRIRKELQQIIRMIQYMGGSVRKEMSRHVTHLIANSCSGEKYHYAVTFRVPILGVSWVHASWQERFNLLAPPASDPEIVTKYKLKPFFGSKIHFFGFATDEQAHMSAVLLQNGGTLVDLEDPSCTHLVVDVLNVKPEDMPDKNHLTGDCWIVGSEWFWLSVQQETCAKEIEFIIDQGTSNGDANTPLSSTPVSALLSTSARARKRKRHLFTNRDSRGSTNGEQVISPAGTKRRSSSSLIMDTPGGGLARLSLSGSFLDSTLSPEPGTSVPDHAAGSTPSGAASPAPQPPSRRQMVFRELLQTETNYVEILHTVMTHFKEPLENVTSGESKLLEKTDLRTIFGNLPPIYEVHQDMLTQLQRAADSWCDNSTRVGAILLQFREAILKAYPPFINFFEDTKKTLVACDENNPRFHAFLKIRMSRPECGRQSLAELLIRPVQRLPSISLLLNDLLKQTPANNPDHELLQKALSEIKSVMTLINEDKRKTESQIKVFDIFNDIENCPPELISSHRMFVERFDVVERSSELSGRGDQLALFLFTDVLEVCKKRSKAFGSLRSPSVTSLHASRMPSIKSYKHIRLLPLSAIKRVLDVKEADDYHNMFALRCRSNHELKEREFLFAMSNEDDNKIAFLRLLCRQLANSVCRTDAESFLHQLDPSQLDFEPCDANMGTLSKALRRTRKKVGRAFSFNKTPTKLKRVMSTVMSPFNSNTTPSRQLESMHLNSNMGSLTSLTSCASLAEFGSPRPIAESLEPPLSVQPVRKNKNPPTLHRY